MAEGHLWCLITQKPTQLSRNLKRCQYVQHMKLCVVPHRAETEHMWESLLYVNYPPSSYILYVTKALIFCESLPFELLNSTFHGNGCFFNKVSCFLPSIQVSLVLGHKNPEPLWRSPPNPIIYWHCFHDGNTKAHILCCALTDN